MCYGQTDKISSVQKELLKEMAKLSHAAMFFSDSGYSGEERVERGGHQVLLLSIDGVCLHFIQNLVVTQEDVAILFKITERMRNYLIKHIQSGYYIYKLYDNLDELRYDCQSSSFQLD